MRPILLVDIDGVIIVQGLGRPAGEFEDVVDLWTITGPEGDAGPIRAA